MERIVVVAVCGYVYLNLRNLRSGRYLARDSGWELVYKSFLYGSFHIALAFGVWLGLDVVLPGVARELRLFATYAFGEDNLLVAVAAGALPLVVLTANLATSRFFMAVRAALGVGYTEGARGMGQRYRDVMRGESETLIEPSSALWQLLYENVGQMVLVTLESRKVYIGFLSRVELREYVPFDERTLTLILLKSGYRNVDTLAVEYTTNYKDVDISLTLFVRHVVSLSKYDIEADSHFAQQRTPAPS